MGIAIVMLVAMAVGLTLAAVENAQKYYVEHEEENNYNVTKDLNGQTLLTNNQKGLSIFYKLNLESATKYFIEKSFVYMIGISLIGILLLYVMVNRALRPLGELDKKIKQINEDNLNERLEIMGKDKEIISLTESFNLMLSRLEKSFVNQKRFVSNVAHELRTPLTIVKTDIEVLKLGDAPTLEEYKENLEIIEQSNMRLIQVVEKLLELMDESEQNFDDRVIIDEMIESVMEELQRKAEGQNISLSNQCERCYVKGNTILLYRAFFNLIENAIKYNQEGGTVKVNAVLEKENVCISIVDNGMGIPEESLENIFETFYRVEDSRSRDLGGAGIGLALVKNIIQRHGGHIQVKSKLGEGTEFKVEFKAYKNLHY